MGVGVFLCERVVYATLHGVFEYVWYSIDWTCACVVLLCAD